MTFRFKAGAAISCKACLAELTDREPRERGVKNLLNFRGVMEGCRRSFLPFGPYIEGLGGERLDSWLDNGSS